MHCDVRNRVGVVDIIEGDEVPFARDADGVRFEGAGAARATGGPGGGPARENEASGTGDGGEEGRAGSVSYGLSS